MRLLLLATFLLTCVAATAAGASSSDWHKADGAHLRLLTSGQPDASGLLRGALEIELKPGWKTYWRDPGASGVPPTIDVSANADIISLDIGYPAPMRFDDEGGSWVGYKHSVSFPLTFRLNPAADLSEITANVFIGVCEAVCIPLQANLTVDTASAPDNADDLASVETAFSALPAPARPEFQTTLRSVAPEMIVVGAVSPGDAASAEFFLAGTDGYVFGTPVRALSGGEAIFTVPVLERPASTPVGDGLPYTLMTATGAVSGFLPFP